MAKDFSRISPTAVMVAYFRANYTDMPFVRKIYDKVRLVQKSSTLEKFIPLLGWLARFFPGNLEKLSSLEGRYLATNNALASLDDDVAIIEVACGLSSRGLEWADKNFLYVETDLPEILETKKQIFAEIVKEEKIVPNPNHVFLPLNVINYEEWDKIGKQYFADKIKKVAIVHEGLVAYLDRTEQETLRDNIRKFLETYSPRGAWITPDFNIIRRDSDGGLIRFAKKLIERDTKRKFNHFSSHEMVRTFLEDGGLSGVLLDNTFVLEQLTCIPKMGMDREEVKKTLERYKVYSISLK